MKGDDGYIDLVDEIWTVAKRPRGIFFVYPKEKESIDIDSHSGVSIFLKNCQL